MDHKTYRKIDLSKLTFSEEVKTIADGLAEETPFEWSESVLNGEKTVVIKRSREK